MSVHEYRSGGWTAIVAQDGVALLDPGVSPEVARELWQLTSAGRRLGAWVEYLAGAGIATLPAFAMVEAHEGRLRVLVRGDVEITTAERTVSGRGYTTWREDVLDAATEVTLTAQPGTGAWLPISGGIVAAGAIRFGPTGTEELVLDDEEDVELTVARMPALAAYTGATSADPADAPSADADPDADTDPDAAAAPGAASEVGLAPGTAAPDSDAAARAAAMFAPRPAATGPSAPATPAVAPEPVVPEPAAPEPVAPEPAQDPTGDVVEPGLPAVDETDEDAADSDEYDHLLWSTEQSKQHTSALAEELEAQPADEPSAPAPAAPADSAVDLGAEGAADPEATQAPEPDPSDGWHTGQSVAAPPTPAAAPSSAPAERPGLIDSVPGLSRPTPPPSAPIAAPPPTGGLPPAPVGRPVDLPPPSGVPEPYPQDDIDDGDHDGETILASDLPRSDVPIADDPAPDVLPEIELVLPNGPRVELTRPVLLGRAPEASRFVGGEAPRLVSVPNPEKDVSGTHVEVRPAGSHVVVTDMNSTNGTVVTLPGQPAFRLQPGTGVPVPAGSVIELGVGVTVRVALVGEEA